MLESHIQIKISSIKDTLLQKLHVGVTQFRRNVSMDSLFMMVG